MAEKRERAIEATAATATRAARLAAARTKVEAAAAVDVARVVAVELEALRNSSDSSSASVDCNTNDELRLAREVVRCDKIVECGIKMKLLCFTVVDELVLKSQPHMTSCDTGTTCSLAMSCILPLIVPKI